MAATGKLHIKSTAVHASLPVDNCAADVANRIKCYDNYFNEVIKTQGAKVALDKVAELTTNDRGFEADCHAIVHTVGRNAYKFYGSVSAASKFGTEVCASGYYHGIMEAYMGKFDDAALLAKMPTICEPSGQAYNLSYYNCLHGLGHGLTIRFNQDIFKALPYCEAIGKSWESQSCDSGVFMQNIVADGVNHVSVDLKADDPVYPCDAVPEQQKNPCFLIQTSNILKAKGYDYAASFVVCDGVEKPYIGTCYQSMGRDISGNTLRDPDKIIADCSLGQAEHQADCYSGASKEITWQDHGDKRTKLLCDKLKGGLASSCLSARDEIVASFN
ncbi:MAG TPA: hypothetical protein VLF41_01605 [Candidatus Nanoarchaeia archaeon]|nr:hypothetical protein [Candidatus Nanoarchaeia archaeon]